MVSLPAVTPVTTPVLPTVDMAALLVLHTPPEVVSYRSVVCPGQRLSFPVIAPTLGEGLTNTKILMVSAPLHSETITLKVSLPLYPVAGVYVSPDGVIMPPV